MTDKNTLAACGIFLVISSPSGAGKTSICRHLLRDPQLFLSVSMTTRPRRANEVDGKDYHFVETQSFAALEAKNAFLESAKVFGHYYGTPRAPIDKALADGKDILFDIDWQGAQRLAANHQARLVRVFVLPPSAKALRERLVTRAQDSKQSRERRMRGARNEISHYTEYDYIFINSDLARSVDIVQAILTAERARRERKADLEAFATDLMDELGPAK